MMKMGSPNPGGEDHEQQRPCAIIYAMIMIMLATVVMDTSVLVSALIGARGPSREILKRCLRGKYRPLVSNALFFEYEDTCGREQILESCPLTRWEIRDLLDAFYAVCQWAPIHYLWRPNSKDEGDNFLIELALAGNASIIVTNNVRDFRSMELHFSGLRVLTPEQLLRMTVDKVK
uniref:Putative toxin-antitoxin system toxin component, PIN family n=1 Tax=Candidatus Kentrum sp. LPFa TaxID=2126335 RepID=A0A450WNT2_9GAMM|nr:MAG: putative toxin-antitoxin system toxin component, PIN family [Candidatus Kentron sp. LPFa]